VIPAGSLLGRWQASESAEEKAGLADAVQLLLTSGTPAQKDSPDAALFRQLTSLGGPLFSGMLRTKSDPLTPSLSPTGGEDDRKAVEGGGLDRAQFGKHPNGS